MAFKTKREKYAFVKGIKKGMKGGKPYGKKKPQKKKARNRSGNPFGMSYHQMLREGAAQKRSLMDDFEYDSRGRIKGHYTVDGKFEPD